MASNKEILPDGINAVDDDGDVVIRDDLVDKRGIIGNSIVHENDGEDFGFFTDKIPDQTKTRYKRGALPQETVLAAGDIIFGDNRFDHRGVYDLGDVSTLESDPIPEQLTDEEISIDEELLEGTSAAGKKRSVRAAEAYRNHGFIPSSYGALVRYSLREAIGRVGGTATVFNKIFIRQKKLTEAKMEEARRLDDQWDYTDEIEFPDPESPKKTMFAIAKEYKGYIEQARSALSSLKQLDESLEDEDDAKPLDELRLFKNKAWRHDGWIYKAVVTMQLMNDGDALAKGKTEKLPGIASYYVNDPEVANKLDTGVVQSMDVVQAKARVKEGIDRYTKEYQYFVDQLQEVVKFGHRNNLASIAARKTLEALHVLDPEAA